MSLKPYLLVLLVLGLVPAVHAQSINHQVVVDSLRKQLHTTQKPDERAKLLAQIAYAYRYIQPDSAVFYGQQVVMPEAKTACNTCLAQAHLAMGTAERQLGDYTKALYSYQSALGIYSSLNADPDVASVLDNIGLIHRKQGNYELALQHLQRALDMRTATKDTVAMARSWAVFAKVYTDQRRLVEARDLLNRAIQVFARASLKYELASAYNDLGKTYLQEDDTRTAIRWHLEANIIWRALDDQNQMADAYASFASVYLQKQNYTKVLEYADKALSIYVPLSKRADYAPLYHQQGQALLAMGKIAEAEASFLQAYIVAYELGMKQLLVDCCSSLVNVYSSMGNKTQETTFRKALEEAKKKL